MQSFDFIIVGAGSAGCVLANRLTADPQNRVLLLEAGGKDDRPLMAMPLAWRDTFMDPHVNWGFLSEPEPYANDRQIPAPRGKVLGGSSSVNGMMYSRGYPVDYDHWRQLGLRGWSYAEVLPYFKKSENNWRGENQWHGTGGELSVSRHRPDKTICPALEKTARAMGYRILEDFHAADAEGFSTPEFTVHQGRRGSTSARFLHPVRHRPNLVVGTGALTHRVLIEKGRAIGVEYEQGGEVCRAMAEREVILSSGAFNSPQLLLLSGVGPADELKDVGITPVSMMAKPWFPLWRKGAGHVLSCANVLLRPESRGEVTLRSSDPRDKPKIQFNLLKAQADRETFRRMVRFGRRFFETEPAASLVEGPVVPGADVQTDEEIDAYVRRFIGTAMHPTSTCAMGSTDDAVLDETCCVRGLGGLRVVDASVMPTIIGGNTNAPVIMIAEKAADMILGKAPLAPAALEQAA